MSDDRVTLLRSAPEPRSKAIPADEAVSIAKAAFYAARRVQLELMACYLNQMLFDPRMVDRSRLMGLRFEARKQVELAQKVEQLLGGAIDAFEATQ